MADTFPVAASPRPLVPGGRIVLRGRAEGLRPGSRILVVYRQDSGEAGPRRVGTIGLVWGIERSSEGPDLLQVRGEMLATIEGVNGGGRATVSPVETGGASAAGAIEEVQRLLRTYLGASAEAGEGGDIGASLSHDLVIASHQVASLLRISAPELQELLESGNAEERLRRAAEILRRETGLLRRTMGGRGA